MSITPKNWATFQHYKDRSPAWIKLHRGLLDDFAFNRLPLASRALAPMLWLLASEYESGKITATFEEMAFRLRVSEDEFEGAINPLIEKGFFISDSALLAQCKRTAIPEKEDIENKKQDRGEKDIRAVAVATRPDAFEEFWKIYPKREGANPKATARKKFLSLVKSGVDPAALIAAVRGHAAEEARLGHIRTPYVCQAVVWLNQRRDEDFSVSAPDIAPGSPPIPPAPDMPTDEQLRRKYTDATERKSGSPEVPKIHSAGDKPREDEGDGNEGQPGTGHRARDSGVGGVETILPGGVGVDANRDDPCREKADQGKLLHGSGAMAGMVRCDQPEIGQQSPRANGHASRVMKELADRAARRTDSTDQTQETA